MKALSWTLLILAALAAAFFLFLSPVKETGKVEEGKAAVGAAISDEARQTGSPKEKVPLPEAASIEDRATRTDLPANAAPSAGKAPASTQLAGKVADSAGKALHGVEVSLFETKEFEMEISRNSESDPEKQEKPIATTQTGPDGRFRFPDLRFSSQEKSEASFAVRLQLHREGFADTGPRLVSLTRGAVRELETIVLYRESSIAGRIEAPGIELRSLRAQARKVASSPDFASIMNFAQMAQVKADGSFEIQGLTPGEWIVFGSAQTFLPASSEPIAIAEGERKTGIVLRLQEGLSIQGRVSGLRGEGVAGAEIVLTRMFQSVDEISEHASFFGAGLDEKNLTDAQGNFTVSGLHPGEYALRVKANGYSEASRSGVKAGSVGIDFSLGERGGISGTLVDEKTGTPVASAKISAERVQQGIMIVMSGRENPQTQTDSFGAFRLGSLEPGRYRLEIAKEGFAPKTIPDLLVDASRETAMGTISLGHGGRLLVQVTEAADEKPIASALARLTVLPEAERGSFGHGERRVMVGGPEKARETRQARSDARGVAAFENLPAGRYLVEASDPERAGAKEEILLGEGEERSVTLRLATGASVCGKTLAVDGSSYPSVSVRFLSENGERFDTISDAQGHYCVRHLPAGKYWAQLREDAEGMEDMIRIEGMDSDPEGIELSCADGQDLTLDLQATPKGSLSGIVRQAGSPTEGVRVNVTKGPADFGMMTFGSDAKLGSSNAEGAYRIEKIKPGKYTISAARPGAALPVKASFEVVPGENRFDLEIPGGTIEGTVLDAASGKPVRGARVVVEEDTGKERRQMMSIAIMMDGESGAGSVVTADGLGDPSKTDAEGKFRLRDLPSGKFRLRVKDTAGYADAEISGIELTKDERKQGIEIKLEPGGTVRGRLLDDAGNPVSFGILFLEKTGKSALPKITSVGPDGKFRFEGVVAGSYKLRSGMGGQESDPVELTVKAGETVERDLRLSKK